MSVFTSSDSCRDCISTQPWGLLFEALDDFDCLEKIADQKIRLCIMPGQFVADVTFAAAHKQRRAPHSFARARMSPRPSPTM